MSPVGESTAVATEGQRRLLALPRSLRAVAADVGVSKTMVSNWRSGTKLPGLILRERLAALYQIPVSAWDVKPGAAPQIAAAEATSSEVSDTLDLVNVRLRAIETRMRATDLAEAVRARLEDTYSKQLALRARLERDRAIELDQFVRGAEWKRVRAALFAALRPFPDAARAAAEALAEIDP